VLASSQVNGMVAELPTTMVIIENIKTSKHQNIKIIKNKQIT
jgi:hypothetical protein